MCYVLKRKKFNLESWIININFEDAKSREQYRAFMGKGFTSLTFPYTNQFDYKKAAGWIKDPWPAPLKNVNNEVKKLKLVQSRNSLRSPKTIFVVIIFDNESTFGYKVANYG